MTATATMTELFAFLNTRRVAAGLKPLKSWKESRMKLQAAIATLDLNRQLAEKADSTSSHKVKLSELKGGKDMLAQVARAADAAHVDVTAKRKEKDAAIARTAKRMAAEVGEAVAREHARPVKSTQSEKDTSPKKASKKLDVKKPKTDAKNKDVDGVSVGAIAAGIGMDAKVARAKLRRAKGVPQGIDGGWLWKAKDVDAVKALLTGDARKK